MPSLTDAFIHLGLGAAAVPQPPFTDGSWYQGYKERQTNDGAEGRLVSMFTFTGDLVSWEIHPEGEEVVLCTAGRMTLHQEFADGRTATATIGPGGLIHFLLSKMEQSSSVHSVVYGDGPVPSTSLRNFAMFRHWQIVRDSQGGSKTAIFERLPTLA